mmetsp:Transcript_13018/g.19738  ORF Transcript_13018/g.19738 Transcript_13018/m.19738 type:complete len:253 (+) Transcript_13018:59-817(+)|eukprot:CAMPEP_0206561202 /NCGR_PEP_ID=MMETSP0325_2-20121206/21475_1 /ASSEMBLY_ACC=CAM_ASM_000347 /TAXON_ID=2866 /ORGANISM="Crypthecodinium cohnii, Strain Seligo" /LENGTH=252 /DNA_ID=CAMNT_0054063101 /DNA_START=67 /DNA_END=825 /DNA_ORIENTATION=+
MAGAGSGVASSSNSCHFSHSHTVCMQGRVRWYSLGCFLVLQLLLQLQMPGALAATMSLEEARSVLSVSPGATEGEIKSAYRAMSVKTHPDKGGSQSEFIKVAQAYETLKHGGPAAGRQRPSSSFPEGMTEEEMMKHADELFKTVFQTLEVLSDGEQAAKVVDDFFFKDDNGKDIELGMAGRFFRWTMGKVVSLAAPYILDLIQSDNVHLNVNGEQMSGADIRNIKRMQDEKRGRGKKGKAKLDSHKQEQVDL